MEGNGSPGEEEIHIFMLESRRGKIGRKETQRELDGAESLQITINHQGGMQGRKVEKELGGKIGRNAEGREPGVISLLV